MAKLDNLTGKTFGRLTVVGPYFRHKGKTVWPCRCSCGKMTDVPVTNLKIGNTKSCGCFRRDFTTAKNTTHGLGRPPEYTVWANMRARCSNPNDVSYADYGGRGITVCDRWESFENFYADMGSRPTPDHQLDREDNMAGYGPTNCRWVTRVENCSNRRDNLFVEWRGETHTVSEWARRVGMLSSTLYARIYVMRWGVEAAMTTPVRRHRRKAA